MRMIWGRGRTVSKELDPFLLPDPDSIMQVGARCFPNYFDEMRCEMFETGLIDDNERGLESIVPR
jgi:hypothetical protein